MSAEPYRSLPAPATLNRVVSGTMGQLGFVDTARIRNVLITLAVAAFGIGLFIADVSHVWVLLGIGIFAPVIPWLLAGHRFRGPGGALVEVRAAVAGDTIFLTASDPQTGALAAGGEFRAGGWCHRAGPFRTARPTFNAFLVQYVVRALAELRGEPVRTAREEAMGIVMLGAVALRLEARGFRVSGSRRALAVPLFTVAIGVAALSGAVCGALDLGKEISMFVMGAAGTFFTGMLAPTATSQPLRVEGHGVRLSLKDSMDDGRYWFTLEGKDRLRGHGKTLVVAEMLDEELNPRNPRALDEAVDRALGTG
jgi:hypothetical protein